MGIALPWHKLLLLLLLAELFGTGEPAVVVLLQLLGSATVKEDGEEEGCSFEFHDGSAEMCSLQPNNNKLQVRYQCEQQQQQLDLQEEYGTRTVETS